MSHMVWSEATVSVHQLYFSLPTGVPSPSIYTQPNEAYDLHGSNGRDSSRTDHTPTSTSVVYEKVY